MGAVGIGLVALARRSIDAAVMAHPPRIV